MGAHRSGLGGGLITASALVVVLAGCTSGGEPGPTARPSTTSVAQVALDEALRDAAWADDVAAARRLVAQGADVDAKDVMLAMSGVWLVPDGPEWDAQVRRLLDLVVDGLRYGA